MLRAVLDTNTFISNLLVDAGPSAQVVDAWRALRYDLITSPDILAEVVQVTSYPRIRRKYTVTDEDVSELLEAINRFATVIQPIIDVSGSVLADPKDEIVIACAVAGFADVIVSGDHHLLDLESYRGIRVVTAVQFLAELTTAEEDPLDS